MAERWLNLQQFNYRAATAQGRIEQGRREAESREQLIQQLKAAGKYPLEVTERAPAALGWGGRTFSRQERLNFTQQLGGLLSAGIPLERALAIVSRLNLPPQVDKVVQGLRRSLQEGLSFTAALERFPGHFPALYVNMVRAGEAGGILPQVLEKLAQYQEEEISLRRFVVSSLFYPCIVVTASIGAILFYVGVVVPKFESIFLDMGSELPWVTRMVMLFGQGLRDFWFVLAGLVAALALWLARESATSAGRFRLDRIKLKLPWIGPILQKIATSRMALSLSLLTGSGVPLLTGLEITADVMGNEAMARALKQVAREVKQGQSLAGGMAAQEVIPLLAAEMIGVGEESGSLGLMLDKVAKTYEGEVRHSMGIFLAVFEPLLILFMVGIIAILAMAILLPITNMNSQINPLG
jgi:general secretion pathway protein F